VSKKEKACYICGCTPAGTVDHVPPKNLFAPPAPDDLITLPCCQECNQSYSKDEEYFRVFVLGGSYNHRQAKRIWDSKVRRSLRRKPRFRQKLARDLIPVEVFTRGGVYLGKATALTAESKRINRVIQKIVKGLCYYHYDRRLDDVSFEIYHNPDLNGSNPLVDAWRNTPRCDVGEGVFTYWRAVAQGVPEGSMWWLLFYERALFLVFTIPAAFADDIQADVT